MITAQLLPIGVLMVLTFGTLFVNVFAKNPLIAFTGALCSFGLGRQLLAAISASTDPTSHNPLWLGVYGAWCISVFGVIVAFRLMTKSNKRGY